MKILRRGAPQELFHLICPVPIQEKLLIALARLL